MGLGSDGQSLLERGQEMISNGKAVITSLNEAANLNSAGIEGLQFGKYIKIIWFNICRMLYSIFSFKNFI